MTPVLKIANALSIKPLLRPDGFAVEKEQEGYETHFDAPLAEFNPAVTLFQQLTIRPFVRKTRYCQRREPGCTPRRAA
jgi:hypothetical protein